MSFGCLHSAVRSQDSLKAEPDFPNATRHGRYSQPNYDKEYYLRKSSKMNTAGIILLCAGTALTVGGIIVYNDAMNSEDWGDGLVNGAGGYIAIVAGSAMVITSIPILIVAGSNKRKAMEMSGSLNLQPYRQLADHGLATNFVPSIGLKLSF